MPSFQTILFAATAVLAGFASAAPALGHNNARCACDNVPSIVDNVKSQIATINVNLKAKIAAAKGAKVDVKILSPPILQIKAILEAAVPQVGAIAHDDPKVILPPKGPVNTVPGVATEVDSVIAAIGDILHLGLTAAVDPHAFLNLLPPIDVALPALLQAHFKVLGGLQGDVKGLIKPNVALVANLKACGLTKVLTTLQVN